MLSQYRPASFDNADALSIVESLLQVFKRRRSIRDFEKASFPREILEHCIEIASSAPSGANKQPWTFCLVQNPDTKIRIRKEAEAVEDKFYNTTPNHNWIEDLKHIGTDQHKEFLSEAPYLIVIFSKVYEKDQNHIITKTYYSSESVGIATGFLIASLHMAGLASLTYTPKKMKFLNDILNRPKNERPYLILAIGRPKPNSILPNLTKKTLGQVLKIYQQPSQGDLNEKYN